MEKRILEWLFTGNVGASSKAIAAQMAGINCGEISHPRDPADLRRCVEFLEFVPGAKERFGEMSGVSPQWFRLVTAWNSLTETLKKEMACRTDGRAPETYEAMKAILKS
jgi:hypothetical protein